jgi:hypothetical protein
MKKDYLKPITVVRKVILNPAYNYTNSKGQSCATPQEKMMNREAEEAMKKEEWGKLW